MFYLYENGNYAYDIYESWLWNWLLTISNKIAMLLQQFLLAGVEIILKPSIVLLNCTFPLYCVMSTPQPELKMRFNNLKLYLNHQLCYWIIHSLCIMFCSHPNQNLKWDSIIVLLLKFSNIQYMTDNCVLYNIHILLDKIGLRPYHMTMVP